MSGLRRVLEWGIDPAHQPELLRRRIRLSNVVALSAPLLVFPYTPLFLWLGVTFVGWFAPLVSIATLLSVPPLNRLGYTTLSRMVVVMPSNLVILAEAWVFGVEAQIQILLLATFNFPVLFFDIRERAPLLLCMLTPVALFVLIHLGPSPWVPTRLEEPWMGGLSLMVGMTAFGLVSIALLSYVWASSQDASQLRATNEALRRESNARLKAVAASEAKSRFLANMSHELRTPLNAVIGYAELVAEELDERELLETVDEDLWRIRDAGQQLLRLINAILDLARIEAGHEQIARRAFAPRELLEEVVDLLRPAALEADCELSIEVDEAVAPLTSDRDKVCQIMVHLGTNAVNFSPGGRVVLGLRRTAKEAIFEVIDNGAGIDQADLERIFESFEQADNSPTRRVGGTGLGLSLSARLAQLLGGRIDVESVLGGGSTFRLHLPAERPGLDKP